MPCSLLAHIELGRINRDSLASLWRDSPALGALRSRSDLALSDFPFCRGCPYVPYCTGNCPALAHTLIGLKSMLRGLNKLILNADAIQADLQKNWAVVAEAIQTVLRRENYPEPYEALKALTRTHTAIDQQAIARFIETLDVSRDVKDELLKITPENYTGICEF